MRKQNSPDALSGLYYYFFNIMNTNLYGNCIPIVFTILNLQYASELAGKKKALCILSVIYSIVGSITIVLLNSNNKQAAFEWFVLYTLGFLFFRFIRKKSADLLSVATNPQAFDTRDYAYHKIVLIKNMMIALLILVFAFSPLFDKLFSDSEIYGLSRYNYISCAFAYIVYCVFIFRILKNGHPECETKRSDHNEECDSNAYR